MKHPAFSIVVLALGGCATSSPSQGDHGQFFSRLAVLCGTAFEGRVASPAVEADRDFAGKRLVMHVRDCSATEIRIPFHVGDDRSRTWIVTRTGVGLRLKHDHRHEDGSEDKLSRYGGDTASQGTASRQEFPADGESKALFLREDRAVSVTNVWAMEVHPGRLFAYELRRPGRFFRVDFDLARPVSPPPAPAGG